MSETQEINLGNNGISKDIEQQFENDIIGIKPILREFCNISDINIVLSETSIIFGYNPFTKTLEVPLEMYHKYLNRKFNQEFAKYTSIDILKMFFQISVLHEGAHLRDNLINLELEQLNSLVDILNYVNSLVIQIDNENNNSINEKFIPIGKEIFKIYNNIDDILMNQEVVNCKKIHYNQQDLELIYKLFYLIDYIHKTDGEYDFKYNIEKKNYEYIYVGEGNGKYEINIYDNISVDYSIYQNYKSFAYYFLRKHMIPGQDIKLPPIVQQIIGIRYRPDCFKYLVETMKSKFAESEMKYSEDKNISKKMSIIKKSYFEHINLLQNIYSIETKTYNGNIYKFLVELKNKLPKTTGPVLMYNLFEIINYFKITLGIDNHHKYAILPDLRYKIIKALYEPIQKSLIFIDLLDADIKSDDKENQAFEPNLSDKITNFKKIIKIKEKEKINQNIEKTRQQDQYKISNVLSELEPKDKIFYENIKKNYFQEIQQLTDFFINELKVIDTTIKTQTIITKKGKLNYNVLIDAITNDPANIDIGKKFIYTKKIEKKEIIENLKKINVLILGDVSKSMDGFKGERGLLNGIITSLVTGLHMAQLRIQNLLKNPNYKIPIDYVLYDDKIEFFTENLLKTNYNSNDFEKSIALCHQNIQKYAGETLDLHAWEYAGDYIVKLFKINPKLIEELKNNKRKFLIIQIADSDVTKDGIEKLKNIMIPKYGEKIFEKFVIKRIILGKKFKNQIFANQFEEIGILGLNNIFVPEIKKLLTGFFKDFIKNK